MLVELTGESSPTVRKAVDARVASRIFAHDATVWGPDASSEAGVRLAWTLLAEESARLVPEILQLRDQLRERGLTHIVLCGMGGSSLAPEVICKSAGVELTVLDSSHPDMVRRAVADRLEQSVVVVASKSGSTVETDSLMRAYVEALSNAGCRPADHLVVVTDPDSPFDQASTAAGYRVLRANPSVGGRYSALSAFGLVPSGLAGADIEGLLREASALAALAALDDPHRNVALQLGSALGTAANAGIDKLVLWDAQAHGLGDWIEQLVAESTGKHGKGILPVVVPGPDAPNFSPSTPDSFVITLDGDVVPAASSGHAGLVRGGLGAQFMLWEAAVAVAGWAMGINPFDQPDVESAKAAARELLDGEGADTSRSDPLAGIDDLLAQLDPATGYVSIQAYLDRLGLPEFEELRELLARRTGRPVTFGWGPRFLHSTGQYHKGGPRTGVYLQLTDDPIEDLAVPGREFSFGSFIAAQAAGDALVLRGHGRPVLRWHLGDAAEALPVLRAQLA